MSGDEYAPMTPVPSAPSGGECQAQTEDGEPCPVRPGWRLAVARPAADGWATVPIARPVGGRAWSEGDGSWLVCTPHLGAAIVLTDEVYGAAVLVRPHHG